MWAGPKNKRSQGKLFYIVRLITCFALARRVQVVIGAEEFALAVSATVIDTWGQIGPKIYFCCYISARLKPAKDKSKDINTNSLASTAEYKLPLGIVLSLLWLW